MSSSSSSSVCPAKLSLPVSVPVQPPVQYAFVDTNAGQRYAVCDIVRCDFPGTGTYIYRIDVHFGRTMPDDRRRHIISDEYLRDPEGEIYIRLKRTFKNEAVYRAMENIYVNARFDHASVYTLYTQARNLLHTHGGAPMVDLTEGFITRQ
jgi:hypothetical protein